MGKFIVLTSNCFLFIVIQHIVSCFQGYDSSFTLECLEEPPVAQYKGGVVVNPELNDGSNGWKSFGDVNIELRKSSLGNKFLVASKRTQSFHSFTQTFYLEEHKYYVFSAWLRVSNKKADVAAIFETNTSNVTLGWATAREGCWSMLKGGLVPNTSGPAQLYLEAQNTKVDIWGDSFSLQQFTHQEWTSHQDYSIEKVRKTSVRLEVLDEAGRPVSNATVSLKQKRRDFAFGCAINSNILENNRYKKWYLSRFKKTHTVFKNELKWPSNEDRRGVENYSVSDAMVHFAEANKISIRGHCVLWNRKISQPDWAKELPRKQLWAAATHWINSVVNRYKGKFISWDVDNENIHNNFFEVTLNNLEVSSMFHQMAYKIDQRAVPYLNEFNPIEEPTDPNISPQKYVEKVRRTKKHGYIRPLGIGVQGHFRVPNAAYIRTSLDILEKSGSPVWVTELDVVPGQSQKLQADYLKVILDEIYSHSAVQGIILWSAWSSTGCYKMCLTDNNFNNLPTGNVVDAFIGKLTHADDLELRGRTTDSDGIFEASLHHGVYQVRVSRPNGLPSSSTLKQIHVRPNDNASRVYRVTIDDKY